MLNVGFALVLVGLPACAGAYLFVNPSGDRDTNASFVLLFYSAALAASFAFFNPHGTLLSGAFWLKMPGALILGGLIGVLAGWLRRKKGN